MMHALGETLAPARHEGERLRLRRDDVMRRGLAAIFEDGGIGHALALGADRDLRAIVFEIARN